MYIAQNYVSHVKHAQGSIGMRAAHCTYIAQRIG